jgi:hypothetical protein
MKVFSKATGDTVPIGRCDVPEDGELAFDVPLFGPGSASRSASGSAR